MVTHKALVEGDKEKAIFWATSFEKTCVKPIAEAGLLGGVLLQLSPYFQNEGSALDNLKSLLDAVSHQDFDYAAEFRHRSWLDESKKEMDSATLEAMRERNVANVLIDGPGLHVGTEQTADHAYLRFHGRNYDIWYRDEKEDDHRLDRYDYLYKRDQLEPWVPQIKVEEQKESKVRIYFNNHARAKSEELLKLLDTKQKGLERARRNKGLSCMGLIFSRHKNVLYHPFATLPVHEPQILLLVFAACLSLYLHQAADASIILVIILICGLLGFWQERSPADAMARLLEIVQIKAAVLRGRTQKEVPVEEVVPGDVILLRAGDIVPGDSLILQSRDLFANEATLTGDLSSREDASSSGPRPRP